MLVLVGHKSCVNIGQEELRSGVSVVAFPIWLVDRSPNPPCQWPVRISGCADTIVFWLHDVGVDWNWVEMAPCHYLGHLPLSVCMYV